MKRNTNNVCYPTTYDIPLAVTRMKKGRPSTGGILRGNVHLRTYRAQSMDKECANLH